MLLQGENDVILQDLGHAQSVYRLTFFWQCRLAVRHLGDCHSVIKKLLESGSFLFRLFCSFILSNVKCLRLYGLYCSAQIECVYYLPKWVDIARGMSILMS